MSYAVLTIISIATFMSLWKVYQKNIEFFVCILIILSQSFFYLLPKSTITDNLNLILLSIIIILLFERIITHRLILGRYGVWVSLFMVLLIIGILVAYMAGQDLLLGVKAAKYMPVILIYFTVINSSINLNKFLKYYIILAILVAALTVIQSVLGDSLSIFPGIPDWYTEQYERTGMLRLSVGYFVIASAAVISFAIFLQTYNIFYLIAAVCLDIQIVFICQTRAVIVGVALSILFLIVMVKNFSISRVIIIITTCCLLSLGYSFFLTEKPIGIAITNLIKQSQNEISKNKGSYGARRQTYIYYFRQLKQKIFLGQGVLNINWEMNPEKKLKKAGLFLADIGIMDLFVMSGLAGFVWFLFGFLKMWKDILLYREYLQASSYIILATIIMPTIDLFFYSGAIFLFGVFLGLFTNAISVKKIPTTATISRGQE
jgi:hypothetical protein